MHHWGLTALMESYGEVVKGMEKHSCHAMLLLDITGYPANFWQPGCQAQRDSEVEKQQALRTPGHGGCRQRVLGPPSLHTHALQPRHMLSQVSFCTMNQGHISKAHNLSDMGSSREYAAGGIPCR